MKHDMSGAAAVLGAMQAIGRLRPNLHVIGLIAATENLPSGTAQNREMLLNLTLAKQSKSLTQMLKDAWCSQMHWAMQQNMTPRL